MKNKKFGSTAVALFLAFAMIPAGAVSASASVIIPKGNTTEMATIEKPDSEMMETTEATYSDKKLIKAKKVEKLSETYKSETFGNVKLQIPNNWITDKSVDGVKAFMSPEAETSQQMRIIAMVQKQEMEYPEFEELRGSIKEYSKIANSEEKDQVEAFLNMILSQYMGGQSEAKIVSNRNFPGIEISIDVEGDEMKSAIMLGKEYNVFIVSMADAAHKDEVRDCVEKIMRSVKMVAVDNGNVIMKNSNAA